MAAIDLCTLADLQAYLKNTNVQTEPLLSRLISAASNLFLNEIQRVDDFFPAGWTERRNGNGNNRIAVRRNPIISVASVVINNVTVPRSPDGVQGGWINDSTMIYLVSGYPALSLRGFGTWAFNKGFQNVVLTYQAGYETVPYDIAQAVIEIAAQMFKRADHIDQDTVTIGGQQTIGFSRADIPASVKLTVNNYKRRMYPPA